MNGNAFDAAAPGYDSTFTDRQLGRWLRDLVHEPLQEAFDSGDRVLDVGCGTGEDAVWLAQRGVRVTGIDGSSAMLAAATAKAKNAGWEGDVAFHQVDLSTGTADIGAAVGFADPAEGSGAFNGAYSNFGVLNCVADRSALAATLGDLVRPGGCLVLVVMGPFCACETVGHLLRGRPGTAFRRFGKQPSARIGNATLPVWYPSAGTLRREFAPWFEFTGGFGAGVFLPPSDFSDLVDRWPRLFSALATLERGVRRAPGATMVSDHHVTVYERR